MMVQIGRHAACIAPLRLMNDSWTAVSRSLLLPRSHVRRLVLAGAAPKCFPVPVLLLLQSQPLQSPQPTPLTRDRWTVPSAKLSSSQPSPGEYDCNNEPLSTPRPFSLHAWLWDWIRRDWPWLLAVMAAAVGAAAVQIAIPACMGQLVNVLTQSIAPTVANTAAVNLPVTHLPLLLGSLQSFNGPAWRLACLFLLQGFVTFLSIAWVARLGERVASRLRHQLFSHLLRQDIAFFEQHRTGELTGTLMSDVAEFKHALKQCVSQGLKTVTQMIGTLVSLMSLSGLLTLCVVLPLPVIYGMGSLYGAYLRRVSKHCKQCEAICGSRASEVFSNIRVVRAAASEQFECDLFHQLCLDCELASQRFGTDIGLFQGLTNISIGAIVLGVLYLGGSLVANGHMSPGDLMSYLMSIQNTQKALALLSVMFAQTVKASSAFSRIADFLNHQPSIPLLGGLQLEKVQGDIEFHGVHFFYPTRPDQPVLRDFDLRIPQGRIVALCGESGAGKSTIASGLVTLDEYDLKELDASWVRSQMGFIHQEPALFATSILENIRYGLPNASVDDVRWAAEQANAMNFIKSFPDGLDTQVGERGVALSGGQRQRIAIARALLRNPKILILDEATSALDGQSEKVVHEALEKAMAGRTVLIIAHRLSTIERADHIVVMGRGGHILEQGTHSELMRLQGAYHRLHTKWAHQQRE